MPLDEAKPDDYDALLLPGGVMNPDTLRTIPEAVEFVKHFFEDGKPVAAICHGPQLLIEAEVVKGRKLTSFPSLKTDLKNAGAEWVDEVVVCDQGLVTSRKPDDIPKFNDKMIEEFAEGFHAAQERSVEQAGAAPEFSGRRPKTGGLPSSPIPCLQIKVDSWTGWRWAKASAAALFSSGA